MKTIRVVIAATITALILAALFVKIPSQLAQSVALSGKALWVATVAQLYRLNPDDGSTVG